MALSDLWSVLNAIREALPGAQVDVSYYLVFTGVVLLSLMLAGLAGIVAYRLVENVLNASFTSAVKYLVIASIVVLFIGLLLP